MKKALRFSILFLSCSLFAQSPYFVNVKDLGAKGDNYSDDTAAIQKAIDSQSLGGMVVFPCGTYRINPDTLKIRIKGIILQGASRDCAKIMNRKSSGGGVLIDLASVQASDTKIRDLMVLGNNTLGTICVLVGTSDNPKTAHVTLTNAKLTQCDPAIKMYNTWDLGLENSLIEFNIGDGIQMVAPIAVTGVYIHDSRIGSNGGFGVKNFGPGVVTQFTIAQSEVSYNGNTEIVVGPARDWVIRDTWLEEHDSPQIAIDVTGCWRCTIDANHSDHAIIGVYSSYPVNGLTITNNSFTNASGPAVNVRGAAGTSLMLSGNRSDTPILAGGITPSAAANQSPAP